MARELIDYCVLDTLADDLENVEDIVRLLNSPRIGWQHLHPAPFTREEVLPVLLRRIRAGDVRAAVYDPVVKGLVALEPNILPAGDLDKVWFELMPQGRLAHQNWDAPLKADGHDGAAAAAP